MNTAQRYFPALFGVLLLGASWSAAAHHSVNAQFDVTKNKSATGVLTRVELINPHSYMHFDIKDASGKTQAWSFETGAPGALKSMGIAVRDTFKVGETYQLVYSPARSNVGGNTGLLHSVVLPDGRMVAMGGKTNIDASRQLLNK